LCIVSVNIPIYIIRKEGGGMLQRFLVFITLFLVLIFAVLPKSTKSSGGVTKSEEYSGNYNDTSDKEEDGTTLAITNKGYPSTCDQYRGKIKQNADRTGIPAWVGFAVMVQESTCDPTKIGACGDTGLFQVMPSDQSGYIGSLVMGCIGADSMGMFIDRPSSASLLNASFNIETGYTLLAGNLKACKGEMKCALNRYGPAIDYGKPYWEFIYEKQELY
jgi:hypothetical protein